MVIIPIIISIFVFRATVKKVVTAAMPVLKEIVDANNTKVAGSYDPNIEAGSYTAMEFTESKKEQKVGYAYFAVLLIIVFSLYKKIII